MTTLSEEWSRAPWTIKAFAGLTVVAIVANELINGFEWPRFIGSIVLGALMIYWLLQGSRVAWVITLVLEIASVVSLIGVAQDRLTVENPGWSLAVNGTLRVLELFVLLHPSTREWLRSTRKARVNEAAQET